MSVPTRIKICYVLGSLQYGGAEGQVLELIRGLDRERFEASLILERDNDCGRADGLPVRIAVLHSDSRSINSTPRRVYNGLTALMRFCKYLSEVGPTYCPRLSSSSVYLGCQRALTGERPLSRS